MDIDLKATRISRFPVLLRLGEEVQEVPRRL